jgi:hypothetical protein
MNLPQSCHTNSSKSFLPREFPFKQAGILRRPQSYKAIWEDRLWGKLQLIDDLHFKTGV